MKRRFNLHQRIALYMQALGKCRRCGADLQAGWHGDHIQPWSRGGSTDVLNGQALCPTCNHKKGALMPGVQPWPAERALRDWQQEALETYMSANKQDFLMVATPGAGKTIAALAIAHALLRRGSVDQVVVVCPSDNLRTQWAAVADSFGVHLSPAWEPDTGYVTADFCGCVVTYQQVGRGPYHYRLLCQRRTLVILDEIHHAADQRAWGEAIRTAFLPAVYRLGISGTPFRSDNNPIPFVEYRDNKSIADYTYGYGHALRDNICRHVIFPSYDGLMEWLDGADLQRATFTDELSQEDAARRLVTALSWRGNWLREVLAEAHKTLLTVRQSGHPTAGGLVITMDKTHAERVGELLTRITGIAPVLVTSTDPDASEKINRFRDSSDTWIVAIRMVSEGVDIPRLRVGVYATHISTELFFRQAIGRVVRAIPDQEDQPAWFYVPRDPVFVGYIAEIKRERDHVLQEADDRDERERQERLNLGKSGLFMPYSAEARASDVFYDEQSFTVDEITEAQVYASEIGLGLIPSAQMALLVRKIKDSLDMPVAIGQVPVLAPVAPTPAPTKAKFERVKEKRARCNVLASKLDALRGLDYGTTHKLWVRMGNAMVKAATEEDLDRKLAWLKQELATDE